MAARSGLTARIDFSDPHKPDVPWCGSKTCHGGHCWVFVNSLWGVCSGAGIWRRKLTKIALIRNAELSG